MKFIVGFALAAMAAASSFKVVTQHVIVATVTVYGSLPTPGVSNKIVGPNHDQEQPRQQKQSEPQPSSTPSKNSDDGRNSGDVPSYDYAKAALEEHNSVRRAHGANDLRWSEDLVESAQVWADHCAYDPNNPHDTSIDGGGYGQNLAIDPNAKTPIVSAVSMWADEEKGYTNFFSKEPDMTVFEKFGHFTQVVWKDTTHVGCGTTQCADGARTICNYKPPGNILGHYVEIVGA